MSEPKIAAWLVDLEPHKNGIHTGKILHSRIEVSSSAAAIRPHSHHAQGAGHHADPSISEQVAQLALGAGEMDEGFLGKERALENPLRTPPSALYPGERSDFRGEPLD